MKKSFKDLLQMVHLKFIRNLKLNYVLLIVFFPILPLQGQNKKNDPKAIFDEQAREVKVGDVRGFLFGPKITQFYFSANKSDKYLNYWWLTLCMLEDIELKVSELILSEYPNGVQSNINKYIRQYFPFINKNGEQVMVITMSLIDQEELENVTDKMKKYYWKVFDGDQSRYFSIRLNYTLDKFER